MLMSVVMLAGRRAGVTPQLPPDKIAEEGIEEVKNAPSEEDEEAVVASVTHFAFGAGQVWRCASYLFAGQGLRAGVGARGRGSPSR